MWKTIQLKTCFARVRIFLAGFQLSPEVVGVNFGGTTKSYIYIYHYIFLEDVVMWLELLVCLVLQCDSHRIKGPEGKMLLPDLGGSGFG